MARTHIKPEIQIERINALRNTLNQLRSKENRNWLHRPHSKSWSAIEVAKHMLIAQEVYETKIESTLSRLKPIEGSLEAIRPNRTPAFLIKRFPPQNGEIKHKMKTTKKFEPVLDLTSLSNTDVATILDQLDSSLAQLKSWVTAYRTTDVTAIRFNSAIGAIVRFNAAEACEFILCHNERHFQQMANALKG
ncbi:MAG: DinB family protein [Bacteroidia bacterium]|nr:DinB family protein [Bacteroidia bacterium]